ncbi:MAG: tyrosine-type recombinase/integrase [Oscillospiraceae bacterium]|jgi:integrase/recombinase XerD|nr:tyrosine-type recombinase/integrase [Oscillospiraceae bacterium]
MEKLSLERTNTKITTQEAFNRFLRIKKAKNLSPETIRYYDDSFRYFGEYFDITLPCIEITIDTYYGYIEYLQENKNANPITMNSYLRALRTILYFFMEEGYTKQFKISLLKVPKHIKETYTDEELERLLKKPDIKKCNFTEYRNWVMANYFLGTGNRLSTAINVKIGHLDFENSLIFMGKTKNGRQQLIPMSKSLSEVLQEYLIYRKGTEEDYLFCNLHGGQLTRDGTTCLMGKYHKNRGVNKTSIHSYRHTFAKKWILNGGDIFRLQKILGHSSLDMVRNYVEMFNEDLQKDFETFNPLDNFVKDKRADVLRMKK